MHCSHKSHQMLMLHWARKGPVKEGKESFRKRITNVSDHDTLCYHKMTTERYDVDLGGNEA